MTTVRAYQGGKPVEVSVNEDGHDPNAGIETRAADVIPMTDHSGTEPETPLSPRAFTVDDIHLMGGLTWEIASGPETPVFRAGRPLVLRLGERRAGLDRADRPDKNRDCGSLLLAMAASLIRTVPDASGAWVFMVELPVDNNAPVIWMGVADIAQPDDDAEEPVTARPRVIPRPGPELLLANSGAALVALDSLLKTTDTAGIAVKWVDGEETGRGHIIDGLCHIAPNVPLEDVEPFISANSDPNPDRAQSTENDMESGAAPDPMPLFTAPRRVPVRLVGGIGAVAGLLLAGVFVVLPMIEEAFRAPPPPPPEMVSVSIAEGAFATTCTSSLDDWWPRVVGWTLSSTGCALAGHLPVSPVLPQPGQPERLIAPLVIWRHLTPEGNRNPVLAQSAAEQVIESWPHEARLDATGLTLWQVATLPLERIERAGAEALSPDQIRARLAVLWADAPEAVTRTTDPNAGTDPGSGTDLFSIAPPASTPVSDLFARAANIPGIAPVRLVQSGTENAGSALVLAPVRTRTVPVTLFEDAPDGGGSQ